MSLKLDPKYEKAVSHVLPLLASLATRCLSKAYDRIIALGENGRIKQKFNNLHEGKNTDLVLTADLESEMSMLAVLDEFGKLHGIKFLVFGEETGWSVVGDLSSKAVVTVFIDGVDGTENFALGGKAKYDSGPMIAICLTDNPTFAQTYVAGTVMLKSNWMLVADSYKREVRWIGLAEDVSEFDMSLQPFGERPNLQNIGFVDEQILMDDYAPQAQHVIHSKGLTRFARTGSTAATIVLLALAGMERKSSLPAMNQTYTALILDQFDKRELEQPVLYLIMKLLGGVMADPQGNRFDDYVILSSGSNAKPAQIVLFTLAISEKLYTECRRLVNR